MSGEDWRNVVTLVALVVGSRVFFRVRPWRFVVRRFQRG